MGRKQEKRSIDSGKLDRAIRDCGLTQTQAACLAKVGYETLNKAINDAEATYRLIEPVIKALNQRIIEEKLPLQKFAPHEFFIVPKVHTEHPTISNSGLSNDSDGPQKLLIDRPDEFFESQSVLPISGALHAEPKDDPSPDVTHMRTAHPPVGRVLIPTVNNVVPYAIAFPIARNRVLTVASALKIDTPQQRNRWYERVELRWSSADAVSLSEQQPARLLWNGHDAGWNVAVLETVLPEPCAEPTAIAWNSPTEGIDVDWFGATEENPSLRDGSIVPLRGTVAAALSMTGLSINLAPDLGARVEGLQMRGSPIFCAGKLLGVVVDCEGTVVHGYSLSQLVNDPGFLHATGLSVEELGAARRAAARAEIAALLSTQPAVAACFLDWAQRRRSTSLAVGNLTPVDQNKAIADLLLLKQVSTKVVLEELHALLKEHQFAFDQEAAQAFLRIVRYVLPHQAETDLPLQLHLDAGGILSLNAWTEAMTELALARLESRAAHFVKPDDSGDLPRGVAALSEREFWNPELGATPMESRAAAVVNHLYEKVEVIDAITGKVHPVVSHEGRKNTDSESRVRVLRAQLSKWLKRGCAPYFTFRQSDDQQAADHREQGALEQLAKAVKQWTPEFVVVRLSGKGTNYEQELEQLDTLRMLIDELLTHSLAKKNLSNDASPSTR